MTYLWSTDAPHGTRHSADPSAAWLARGLWCINHWPQAEDSIRIESDQSWNYRRMEAILATDSKQSPTKQELCQAGEVFYLIWFSGATHPPCPHETPKSDHGYEVMFWKRDLSGTSFIAASEVKCPLRKSPQLLKQSYKFLKNEQFFPCLTSKKSQKKTQKTISCECENWQPQYLWYLPW